MPAWTDCATRRSHPARSHPSDGSMRLRVPIRHDERIGNIAADEALPSVILPGSVPLEMCGDTHSTAPFTGHRVLHWGFGKGMCGGKSSRTRCTAVSAAIADSPSTGQRPVSRMLSGDPVHRNIFPVSLDRQARHFQRMRPISQRST
jgi:hypothetical protein